MSGALMALAGASGSEGGYSGNPGTIVWGNIVAVDGGTNNSQTLTGITGSMSVSATITGSGNLFYTLNGVSQNYTGAFLWPAGQTLCWGVNSGGGANVSGTVTVTNASADTSLGSFTYSVRNSISGDL